jgi:uncharacterized protein (TIGR03435 family)
MIPKPAATVSRRILWALICSALLGASAQSPPQLTIVTPAPLDSVPPKINFDIVSFKKCPPDKFDSTKVDMPMTADYVAYHCQPLSRIIYFAYNGSVKVYSVDSTYPKWVDDDRYEFIAKVAPEDFAAWQQLDLAARRLLIRKVLADTVKLKIHVENSPKAIYALTATKKVNLKTYKEGDQTTLPNGDVLTGRSYEWIGLTAHFQAYTMADLAEVLTINMDRLVADHTNLPDRYNFALPMAGHDMEPDSHMFDDNAPTIEDGLEALGLRLVPTKAPVERLVIDHIEKPEED